MRNYVLLLSTFLLLALSSTAQESRDLRKVYSDAENAYRIGQLEEAINLLKTDLNAFQGNERINALRLLAICYLTKDDTDQSETYAQRLLRENPYYTPVQDPIRFEEMINRLKSGRYSTITTASSQAESLNEAPVPVTIITREMIDAMSYQKSIGQILAAYVPGMSEVCNYAFSSVAMHGVYTSGQEKMLVMINGHRLNARSTNNGVLDYSISTEKIDHIEVLRGPASSLYGNVALTAVVNIITKSGHEIDGIQAKYGLGGNGTHRADILAGTSYMGADVMAWASLYRSGGERIEIPKLSGFSQTQHDGYAYVGRYDGKPSYDLGCRVMLNDFIFMLNRKSGKLVPQYSWYGETYDYDRFRQLAGVTPGFTTEETHLELAYNKDLIHTNISLSVYGDWYKFNDYQPVSDSLITYEFSSDGSGKPLTDSLGNLKRRLYHGVYQEDNWEEYTIGALAKLSHSFHWGSTTGQILVGGQFEYYRIPTNEFFFGEEYDRILIATTPSSPNQLKTGSEKSVSGFLQEKHYLLPGLIANVGFRYDMKFRTQHKTVSAFSPRVAVIYTPSKYLSMKLSGASSFVDAPYFYRQNSQNTYRGSEDLMPEKMKSIQLDILGTLPRYNLNYELCFFYNKVSDMIVNNQSTDLNAPKFVNAGNLKMAGVEAVADYRTSSLRARLNMSYQYAIDADQYYYEPHQVYSMPAFKAHLLCEKRLLQRPRHELWLSGNISQVTGTLNRANRKVAGATSFRMDGYTLVDIGLRYTYHKFLQFSFHCENVFDKSYQIGGTSYFPYQYPGRMVMGTVSLFR